MAQRYKFFNSGVNDPRKYQASDFADYFGSVLSTGLLHTDEVPGMSVSVEAGTLNTIVSPGKAIMKGYLYENTSPLTLEHSVPEPTLDRIDRIVLRLDLRNSERNILLHVKEGMPAENPVPPELQRDNLIHEISLAQIRVRADTVQLLPSDLVDERLDEELCGLVNSLLTVPTSQFQQQWDLFFAQKSSEIEQATDDFEDHVLSEKQRTLQEANDFVQTLLDMEQQFQQQLDDSIEDFEQQWDDWFSQQQTEGFVLQSEKGEPGGVAKQDDFAAHLAEKATQPEGVHGLRVQNGQLEYWDKDEQEWKRIAGGVEVPLGNVKNFHAVPGNGQVTLFWEDPDDVEVEGVVVSKWAGTKILRKVGSWSENENDGVLVVNNGIRNQYAEDGFVDSGLENDVTYYYMAFPYNTQGLYTVSEANRASATPQEIKIYGLEWNQTLDTYERLDDAVGMVAITQGQNDFSDVYPWSEMKRCNLDDDGNVLAYYGDPTFKDDGSNGQVMVQIPKFWYRSEMVNEGGEKKYRWWIADAPVEGFKLHPAFSRNGVEKDVIYIGAYEGYVSGGMLHSRAGVAPTASRTIVQFRNDAQARGSIWHQQDFLTICAIQLLYLIEYAHFDSQTKIGRGITNDSSYHQTGETAQYGNESYGTTSNATIAMSYRGIENLYGNYFQWVDGININNHVAYIADHNFQSDKFDEHYRQVGFTNSSSNGYVKDIGWTEIDDFMFLAIDATGSSTSYLHDYYYQSSGARATRFGGYRSSESNAGAFYWYLSSSSSNWSLAIGARLLCVP